MRSKSICILLVGIACSVPAVLTGAFGEDVKVTCPGKGCSCTTVKVRHLLWWPSGLECLAEYACTGRQQ